MSVFTDSLIDQDNLVITDIRLRSQIVLQKDQYQIGLSARNAPQILAQGFKYGLSRNNPLQPKRYWRCTSGNFQLGKRSRCTAAGKLTDDGLLILTGEHFHPATMEELVQFSAIEAPFLY